MKMPAHFRGVNLSLFLWLALFSINARADIDNAGLLDNVLNRYSSAASTWATTITTHATWLFWTLVLISMVWTFGMMALRKADIGEFFAEFVRFTIFTGFFWWLLTNGPNFATSIMNSLRTIAASAVGTGSTIAPSGIVDIGFDIFSKMIDQSSVLSPLNSAVGIAISAAVLIILALISVNMLLLLVSGWILAYAGVFFLGFGGSRWTSDMAINYFKTVLSIAAQLFTMILLVGIGKSFIDLYYNNMSAGMSLKELGVMLVVAVVLLALVNKVPSLVGNLAMGGGTGALGGGFGAGAVVGAATMGAAAAATTGAAMVAGAANIGGGAQALMAAFSKANAQASAGGSSGDLIDAAGNGAGNSGGSGSDGGSAFAAAMGDDSSGTSFGSDNSGGSSASAAAPNVAGAAPEGSGDMKGSTTGAADGNVQSSGTTTDDSNNGNDGGSAQIGDVPSQVKSSNPLAVAGTETGDSNSSNDGGSAQGGNAPDQVKSSNPLAATGTATGDSNSGNDGGSAQSDDAPSQVKSSNPLAAAGTATGDSNSGNDGGSAQSDDAPSQVKSNNPLAAVGSVVARVGKVAVGTAANLAQGSWDVAKAKGDEMIDAMMNRIGETTGGKIATAIKAREATAKTDAGSSASFDNDSLSAGTNESPDAASEVAAFRDRDPKGT